MSILKGSSSGISQYSELHSANTGALGIVNLVIGNGTGKTGDITTIDWGADTYYLKVEIDKTGGTSFVDMGTTQLLSVPYALYAESAGNINVLMDKLLQLQAEVGVTDIDGNHYNGIKIGTQVWMKENLKTTKYNDGVLIPKVADRSVWINLSIPAYCWYDNDSVGNKNLYGASYNWFAVNTGKLCPLGWHVPSDTDWIVLTDLLGGESVAGGKLKESGTTYWQDPNTGANNESGFTGLPGGYSGYIYEAKGNIGVWWSSNEDTSSTPSVSAWQRLIYNNSSSIFRGTGYKYSGYSIRCLKD
jgi:uncharacterized protein (TIGR02145 family)